MIAQEHSQNGIHLGASDLMRKAALVMIVQVALMVLVARAAQIPLDGGLSAY
jgi:hypothetical protein